VGLWATIRSARKVALSWRRRERYCWIRDVKDFSIGVSDSSFLVPSDVMVNLND
jgi:hypothetical protein